MQLGLTLVLKG